MNYGKGVYPSWLKWVTGATGLLMAGGGLIIACGLCTIWLVMVLREQPEAIRFGLFSAFFLIACLGTGGTIFWHSMRSLMGENSSTIHLPPPMRLIVGLVLCLAAVAGLRQGGSLFSLLWPAFALAAVVLPGLAAVAWFAFGQYDRLTWRRALVVYFSSITVGLVVITVLEAGLLAAVSLAASSPADRLVQGVDGLAEFLVGRRDGEISGFTFVVLLVQLAVVIPLLGTLAKSLVTVPLLYRLTQREVFLLGAIAGAGYAALEAVLLVLVGLGTGVWPFLILALGGAVHPLSAGLMAGGWCQVVGGRAGYGWLARYGAAVALHSVWNFGCLILITATGLAQFQVGPERIGLNESVWVLLGLGLVASVAGISILAGRSMSERLAGLAEVDEGELEAIRFTWPANRLALWAVASLLVIVPTGIVVSRFVG